MGLRILPVGFEYIEEIFMQSWRKSEKERNIARKRGWKRLPLKFIGMQAANWIANRLVRGLFISMSMAFWWATMVMEQKNSVVRILNGSCEMAEGFKRVRCVCVGLECRAMVMHERGGVMWADDVARGEFQTPTKKCPDGTLELH